jgi:hypothetical protein
VCCSECQNFWCSGNVTNLDERALITIVKYNLNLKLIYFDLNFIYIKRKGTQMERLFESRFASVVLLFRIAGIPFKIKKLSTLYTIYMITVIFCTSTTFVGMIVDVYVHRDNLRHAVTNIRGSITATNMIWIWCYCR